MSKETVEAELVDEKERDAKYIYFMLEKRATNYSPGFTVYSNGPWWAEQLARNAAKNQYDTPGTKQDWIIVKVKTPEAWRQEALNYTPEED